MNKFQKNFDQIAKEFGYIIMRDGKEISNQEQEKLFKVIKNGDMHKEQLKTIIGTK